MITTAGDDVGAGETAPDIETNCGLVYDELSVLRLSV